MSENLPDAMTSDAAVAPGNLNTSCPDEPKIRMGGPWDDPGWLLENYFRGRHWPADDAATLIIGWLSILPHPIAPPIAARSLLQRFAPPTASAMSSQQRQLLDLLAVVAEHQQQSQPG